MALTLADSAPEIARLGAAIGAAMSHLRTAGFVGVDLASLQAALARMGLLDHTLAADDLRALSDHRIIGGKDSPGTPVVLDGGRYYFRKSWRQEIELAEQLQARATERPARGAEVQEGKLTLNRDQYDAVSRALTGQITIISGGPGTGKTTIVGRLLRSWLAAGLGNPDDVAMAAPTGKAAARLSAALSNAAAESAESNWKAQTLHRLLGWSRDRASFRYHNERPLPYRLVIVDEVSMVDLDTMHALVSALRTEATLVLLGDKDQLSSVQPGNVMGEICAAAEKPGSVLAECLVELTQSHRFGQDSGIGSLADAIRRGDPDAVLDLLRQDVSDRAWCREVPAALELPTPYIEGFRNADPGAALAGAQGFKVLCAHRHGPAGVSTLNRRVAEALRLRGLLGRAGADSHYHNELFVVSGNHYAAGLFNGDQGIIRRENDQLMGYVETSDGGVRAISPARLPAMELAFAMTIHRSQGSEFDEVLVVLPDADSPLLSRELLYTAVTRARRRVTLWGAESALIKAVTSPAQRGAGLADRLAPAGSPAWSGDPVQGDLF